ncbi:membrane protein [Mesorhizobium amorphae CCBAU 01583]|nr:membrane protein [Mesorhizobium amorphae CCBAU 01583]
MLEHEYTVLGGVNRARIGHYLGVISSIVSAGVVFVFLWAVDLAKTFGVSPNVPSSVLSLLGAGTVFIVLYWILDRFAWRWGLLSKVLKVPNLSGDWDCDGQTLNPDGTPGFQWKAKITIVQSWDRIRVRLKTAQSGSNSTSAALIYDEADGYRLFYGYKNDPNIGETELKSHRGSAEITFAKDLRSGKGEYFNGYGRYTFGQMNLTRL